MVDPAFTSERATISEGNDAAAHISSDNQKKFEGFTFIPDDDKKKWFPPLYIYVLM